MENKTRVILGSGIAGVMIISVAMLTFTSVAIYTDFFEKNEYRFTSYSPVNVYFQNNNFLSNVAFNPLFFGSIKIVNATGAVDCFFDVGKNEPCNSTRIDLKKIDSGQQAVLTFYLDPHDNNFTIVATPYLNLSNAPIELPSNHWYCKLVQEQYYWCS